MTLRNVRSALLAWAAPVAIGLAPIGLASPAAALETVPDLYESVAIVTGTQNMPERARGLRVALEQVIVKLTGNIDLISDPRMQEYLQFSSEYDRTISYTDRLAKKKLADEQGTRDRSYLLDVTFKPAEINAILSEVGARRWPAERPKLLMILSVKGELGNFIVGTTPVRTEPQRDTLLMFAERRGIPIALPKLDADETLLITAETIAKPDAGLIERLRKTYAADYLLIGEMNQTAALEWTSQWSLNSGTEEPHAWKAEKLDYDEAMRYGLSQAAKQLAGIKTP
jgi:uncharacterized protein